MTADIYTLKTGDLRDDQPKEDEYGPLIESIYSLLNQQLLELFTNMLDGAENTLKELNTQKELSEDEDGAESEPDEELMQKLTAFRMLHEKRTTINSCFFVAINEKLKTSAAHADDKKEEELSLVDHEEMEEMVAITTMHANALNLFGEEISDMEARVEYLEILSAPIFEKHALNPNHICEAFQIALKPHDLTTANTMALFKYFDEQVNLQLGEMYRSINQLFIDAGVLPEIVLNTQQYEEQEEQEFTTRTATYYDPEENKSTDFVPRSQSEMNHIVSQFMKGNFTVTGDELELPASFYKDPATQNINGKEYYKRKEVVRSLSRLQKKLTELGEEANLVSVEEIKQSLMADIGQSNGGAITREVTIVDERNIDFVGMMFDAITEDESISEVITNLVQQLQIPVIKVAMNDETLFDDENHPARNVLNLIPKAGKGVTEKEDRIYDDIEKIVDRIYDDIEKIVDDLLGEYDVDISSFDKAVDALEDLITNEEALAEENEKKEQRAIIRQHARGVVLKELRYLSSNKRLPKPVQPLVLKHWSTLMLNRYVQFGKDSDQWIQSVMLLKLMLKFLQPIKQQKQWEELSCNHTALIEAVNDELYETQQDKKMIDEQVLSLQKTFAKMLEENGFEMVEDNNQDDDYQEDFMEVSVDEMTQIKEEARVAFEKIKKLPSDVKPGVWFEIFNGEDRAIRRLKMSVVLTEVAKIIFVDRKGVKIIEKDVGEFVDELKNNKSRILADHSTFNHALGRVMASMAA
jgi:hypothetical protein